MSVTNSDDTNKFAKGFLALVSAVSVLALVTGIMSAVREYSSSGDVSWLYSQTAESSELIDLGEGNYRIVLHNVDAHTIQFSDRPERLAEVIGTDELVNAWDSLFSDSSPNAVLVEHEPDGTADSLVVEIEKPVYNGATAELTYQARILVDEEHPKRLKKLAVAYKSPPASTRAVSLFIDNARAASTTTAKASTTTVKSTTTTTKSSTTTSTTTTTVVACRDSTKCETLDPPKNAERNPELEEPDK
jgi:hypothetical protein